MSSSNPPLKGQFTQVWGRSVHYHVRGKGVPILLLHGNGSLGEEILSPFRNYRGVRWIAPDRAGYGVSEPLQRGSEDPEHMAAWALAFADQLQLQKFVLVSHSIAAGAAICLACVAPERLLKLVLLAPFCRPTPHRWMLGLRLAVAPVIGRPVRRLLLPAILPLFRRTVLEGVLQPTPVPSWLKRFPLEHAARSQSLKTMAAELRRFNEGMSHTPFALHVEVRTTAIFGTLDKTALPGWHEAWLRRHITDLEVIKLKGAGHAVHHANRMVALRAITSGCALQEEGYSRIQ